VSKRTENSGENLQVFENSGDFDGIIGCIIFSLEEQSEHRSDTLGNVSMSSPFSPICRASHRRLRNFRLRWLIWLSDSRRYPHLFKRKEDQVD
jgi:hypothetical protein